MTPNGKVESNKFLWILKGRRIYSAFLLLLLSCMTACCAPKTFLASNWWNSRLSWCAAPPAPAAPVAPAASDITPSDPPPKQTRVKTKSAEERRREAFVKAYPHLSPKTKEAILKGYIHLGMTRDQVLASWGKPYDKSESVGSWGTHEQWIYGCNDCKNTYVYIDNGVLSSWSD